MLYAEETETLDGEMCDISSGGFLFSVPTRASRLATEDVCKCIRVRQRMNNGEHGVDWVVDAMHRSVYTAGPSLA